MKNLLKYYKQFLPYKNHQLQRNALKEVSTVLLNVKKNIYHVLILDFKNFPT
jgi:hypothetical protein